MLTLQCNQRHHHRIMQPVGRWTSQYFNVVKDKACDDNFSTKCKGGLLSHVIIFSLILSIYQWHLIQEHCANYAFSMPSCQTVGQILASPHFSVIRFRIKEELLAWLVTQASSGGPQSIPAPNPQYPNSRSSAPLSPPYTVLTVYFALLRCWITVSSRPSGSCLPWTSTTA